MKKTLLTILLTGLAGVSLQATQFWYDTITNYPGGCISTNSGGAWYPHLPGSLTANDALVVTNSYTTGAAVNGKRLRVNGLNTEYVMRLFDQVNTNPVSSGVIYASFIANANFVPAAGAGTYFAAFNDLGTPPSATNGFNFRGRVFEIGNTNTYPFTNTVAGTYRFGVANGAGDPAQGGSASIHYVPIDLIKNVDYQVVLKYDIDNGVAYLWVNPAAETDTANMAPPTTDLAGATSLAGLLFRQRTGGGTVDVRDVVVGDTFADVVTNTTGNPGPVLIATNVFNLTNYSGNPALMEVFATSFGGGPLTYQWYQISGGLTNAVPGAKAQTYFIPSLSGSDQGAYFCAVSNSMFGAWSKTNFVSVNTTATPPTFTVQPKSTSSSVGSTLTLTASAFGTGPLTYQWKFGGNAISDGSNPFGFPNDNCVISGSQTPTLTIAGVSTNETGNYSITVTGGANNTTSTNALVTVNPPRAVSIAFLRSLESTTTWQPTDTSSTFSVTGVVTTATNLTSGNTSSYYLQDSTAGINLFITGDSSFRPALGDLVAASGTLNIFNNSLELQCVFGNPYQTYSIVSHNNPLPAPTVFSPNLTNNAGLMETNLEGRFVMMTNVYFPSSGATPFPAGNVVVTNQGGAPFIIFISSQIPEIIGPPMPVFAYSVLGVLSQFKSGAYSSAGYELNLTSLADIITNQPPAVTAKATLSGNNVVLAWEAVPYNYSYSVLSSGNVSGPYLPVAVGLTFTNTAGLFSMPASGTAQFYKISTP
jgi:hypothetical protein